MSSARARGSIVAVLLVVAGIVYGSLFPFDWQRPEVGGEKPWWSFLFAPPPAVLTRTDLATNVLVYVPLGFAVCAALARYTRVRRALLGAMAAGFCLSVTMELAQAWLPKRVASNVDIAANVLGTLAGALLYRLLQSHRWPGQGLAALRRYCFLPGRLTDLGLVLLALWGLAQLSLEPPSLIAGDLRAGFHPWWEALDDLTRLQPERALVYALELASFGLFARLLVPARTRGMVMLGTLVAAALLVKFLAAAVLIKWTVLARLFSLEAVVGLAAGLGLIVAALLGRPTPPYGALYLSLATLVAMRAFVPGLAPLPPVARPEQLVNITGLAGWIALAWPYLAAAFAAAHWLSRRAVLEPTDERSTPPPR